MGQRYSNTLNPMPDNVWLLHNAVIRNDVETVARVLESGVDVDAPWISYRRPSPKDGITPLCEAIILNHKLVTEVLIKAGASVNQIDKNGLTPLHKAVYHGSYVLADTLIKAGADIHYRDPDSDTPLHICVQHAYIHTLRTETIRVLINAGCQVNAVNKSGKTALHYAAKWALQDVTRLLIKNKCIIDYVDYRFQTPLCSCIYDISTPETVNSRVQYYTPQEQSQSFLWMLPAIRELLKAGCDSLNLATWIRKHNICTKTLHNNDEEFYEWYVSSQPERLKHLCRVAIQMILGYRNEDTTHILALPIPKALQEYLCRKLM